MRTYQGETCKLKGIIFSRHLKKNRTGKWRNKEQDVEQENTTDKNI